MKGLLFIAAIGALLVGWWFFFSAPPNTKEEIATPGEAMDAQVILPTFDTVRIDIDGSAVVAGRAQPFTLVSLLLKEALVASAYVSAEGEWVMVLDKPLRLSAPTYLRLRAKHPNGKIYLSTQLVWIGALLDKRTPTVVLTKEKGSTLLQSNAHLKAEGGALTLDTIDYNETGAVIFSGQARANGKLLLYYKNRLVGQTTSNPQEKWSLEVEIEANEKDAVGPLRLDLLDKNGKVRLRLEVPFLMKKNLKHKKGQVIIHQGDSLWKIARHIYGKGVLYTLIYEQNQNAIKDPNLIYPGQVLETIQP